MIKNFLTNVLMLASIVLLVSACKYPDNLPDWQALSSFRFKTLEFSKTTLSEFKNMVNAESPKKVGSNVSIFNTIPDETSVYKGVRVGFRNKKLDWVEFNLGQSIEMYKFVEIYGKPKDINTKYSSLFDYYDYTFFNVSTNKDHKYVKNITVFEIFKPKFVKNTPEDIVKNNHNIDFLNFLDLKPGITLEEDFQKLYPSLQPLKANEYDSNSTYILEGELGRAKTLYKKATIVFNGGLLNWINLIPLNLSISEVIKKYGSGYTVEQFNSKYLTYDFKSFIAVVNKNTKKVVNVGIVSTK